MFMLNLSDFFCVCVRARPPALACVCVGGGGQQSEFYEFK
jgi:hypothetical protein